MDSKKQSNTNWIQEKFDKGEMGLNTYLRLMTLEVMSEFCSDDELEALERELEYQDGK